MVKGKKNISENMSLQTTPIIIRHDRSKSRIITQTVNLSEYDFSDMDLGEDEGRVCSKFPSNDI